MTLASTATAFDPEANRNTKNSQSSNVSAELSRPDFADVSARFRFWHIEALLDQASSLIERVLDDNRERNALSYANAQQKVDLERESLDLALDTQRQADGVFNRPKDALTLKQTANQDVNGIVNKMMQNAGQIASGDPSSNVTNLQLHDHELTARDRTLDGQLTDTALGWSSTDIGYKNTELANRKLLLQAKQEMASSGGPLDFESQRALCSQRLSRNFQDAIDRTVVAAEGLKTIYGIAPPLPIDTTDKNETITAWAIWISNAVEWLVSYQQLEQAFTLVIPLSKVLDASSSWDAFHEATNGFDAPFRIPMPTFSKYENCRLRGLTAYLIGDSVGTVPWCVTLTPPKAAFYVRGGHSISVSQSDLPGCTLGRVSNIASVRPMETGGVMSLVNASPIGQLIAEGNWNIKIAPPDVASEKFSNITEVVIELSCVGIPLSSDLGSRGIWP